MKKRKDSAFGIHFDFHARHGMRVAEVYRPELIGKLLDCVRPDYVQFDSKGHPGLASYPTEIGKQADCILHDVMRVWREETKKRGIALYAHHSGLYDMHVAQTHPQWAVVDEKGNVSTDYVSVFSPYVDEVLIPQIKELARMYDLNGVWVDGDCWALYADYSENAQRAYAEATGITILPKTGEPGYDAFTAFIKKHFKKYVQHYTEELKKEFPDFQVTSNWIFSGSMSEKVSVPVDFLSGDYESSDSVNSARYQGRIFAAHDFPWDLMSWGQHTHIVDWREENRLNKEAVQLMQEASVCVALGGGFEFFDIMYGYGGLLQEWCIDSWGEVADFVRAREKFCFNSKPVKEIGVLCTNDLTRDAQIYKRMSEPCDIVLALQDSQFSTQMIFEDYAEQFSEFSAMVLPRAVHLKNETIETLKKYVYNGGKLIVDLPSAHYFSDVFEMPKTVEDKLIYVDGCGRLAAMETNVAFMEDLNATQMYLNNYYEAEHYAAYHKVRYGAGLFVFQMFDLGKSCRSDRSQAYLNYIKTLIKETGFVPTVRTSSSLVDVTLMKKDKKLLVNLINMCGAHNENGVRSFSEIPPLVDLQVEIDYPQTPKTVKIEPGAYEPEYTYDGKSIRLTIDKLPIHKIIAIE